MASLEAKVVVLGSQGVGKTSLVVRYNQGTFSDQVTSTIGASFFTHKMTVNQCRAKLQIWDTAGQERFRSMAPMYYRGASAALLVYDVTNPATFEDIRGWVKELRRNTEDDILICLAANKVDMRKSATTKTVSAEEGRDYAESLGMMFFECSAKEDRGIKEAFLEITKRLIQTKARSNSASPEPGEQVQLDRERAFRAPGQSQSKCCG